MKSDKIQLELNANELEQLLKLVYLGEWIANSTKDPSEEIDFEAAEQQVYACAFEAGFDDLVEYNDEISAFIATEKLDEECSPFIGEYDGNIFVEELTSHFVDAELEATYGDELENMDDEKFEELSEKLYQKHYELIEQKGLEKLTLN